MNFRISHSLEAGTRSVNFQTCHHFINTSNAKWKLSSSSRGAAPFFKVNIQRQQHRTISLLHKNMTSSTNKQLQSDLDAAIALVRKYDPSGYLPGILLPHTPTDARLGYFAVRAFWVESGLRSTDLSDLNKQSNKEPTPQERMQWWKDRISSLYFDDHQEEVKHPTLRLLQYFMKQQDNKLSKSLFDDILSSREHDFTVKQYPFVQSLIQHSQQSCGSLLQLGLECVHVSSDANPKSYEAAKLIGVCHGLSNALRTSIPIASQTGKIIIPEELCVKYGVRSPRFLLSALCQGDEKCKLALAHSVQDITLAAREHLSKARDMRQEILKSDGGDRAMAVFLPGLGSETFLNRLERKKFDLTDPELRSVSLLEHGACASRMIMAWFNTTY